MTLRPLQINLVLSALREGSQSIRDGRTDEGLRLIEHGADYLKSNAEPEKSDPPKSSLGIGVA